MCIRRPDRRAVPERLFPDPVAQICPADPDLKNAMMRHSADRIGEFSAGALNGFGDRLGDVLADQTAARAAHAGDVVETAKRGEMVSETAARAKPGEWTEVTVL